MTTTLDMSVVLGPTEDKHIRNPMSADTVFKLFMGTCATASALSATGSRWGERTRPDWLGMSMQIYSHRWVNLQRSWLTSWASERSLCKVLYKPWIDFGDAKVSLMRRNRQKERKTRRGRNHFTAFWYAPILSFVPHGWERWWLRCCSFKSPRLLCLHFKCHSTKYTTSASTRASGLELLHAGWGLLLCICHFLLAIGLQWLAPFPCMRALWLCTTEPKYLCAWWCIA